LDSYCTILSKSGRPFANICTFEVGGVGIFGHVYTVPEERKKGAADLLNRQVMADFIRRGGKALYLGTTFDSPAYHIYEKHRFVGVEAGSGYMVYTPDGQAAFEQRYFAPGPTRVETLDFKHWPVLPALAMMRHPSRLRFLAWKIFGPASTEGGMLEVLKASQETKEPPRFKVAVSQASGTPVAIAGLTPDPWFGSGVDVLDVFFAPGFEGDASNLLEQMELRSDRKVVCGDDGLWPQKQGVLERAGFSREAVLRGHLKDGGKRLDVALWAKMMQ